VTSKDYTMYFVDDVNDTAARVNVSDDDWRTLNARQLLVTEWKLHNTNEQHHVYTTPI